MAFTFQPDKSFYSFGIGMEQKIQKGYIVDDDFHAYDKHVDSDEDFDDGPLRIEEIVDDEDDGENPPVELHPVIQEEPPNPQDLSTWAQDLLDLVDSSISQLEALKIDKKEIPSQLVVEEIEIPRSFEMNLKENADGSSFRVERPKNLVYQKRAEFVGRTGKPAKNLYETLVGDKAGKSGSKRNFWRDDSDEEVEDEFAEIEKIEDVNSLNEMLNATYDYETRRRIRCRIRALNKAKSETIPIDMPKFDISSVDLSIRSLAKIPLDEGYVSVSSPISPDSHDVSFASHESLPVTPSNSPTKTKMGDSYVSGVNLADIDDEIRLHGMLDSSEDIDERKMIRARLREVMAQHRAEREEMIRRREQDREDLLRKRVADSDEHKRRTLAMYDAMAKSAPAGANKNIDVSILRTGVASAQPVPAHQPVDLVEQAIRDRQRNCDEQKKRTLAAFDKAARSGPAGMPKLVDFDNVSREDIATVEKAPKYSATFEMRGGVPNAAKVYLPKPLPQQNVEPQRDLMEEAIRKRQREADERKRRTLAAYDMAARSRPAGQPVSVYIPSTEGIDPVVTVVERPSNRPSTPATPTSQPPLQKPQPMWKPPGQQAPPSPQLYRQQQNQSPQSPQSPQPYRPGQYNKPQTPPTPQPQMYRPPQQQQQQQQPQYRPGQQMWRPQPLQQQPASPPATPPGRQQMNIKTQSVRTVTNPYENQRNQQNQQYQQNQQNQYKQQQQQNYQQNGVRTTTTTQKTITPAQNQYQQQRQQTTTVTTQKTVMPAQQQQRQQTTTVTTQKTIMPSQQQTTVTTQKTVMPAVQQRQQTMVTTQRTVQQQQQQRYYEEEDDEDEYETEEDDE